jgi:hypothetical protein
MALDPEPMGERGRLAQTLELRGADWPHRRLAIGAGVELNDGCTDLPRSLDLARVRVNKKRHPAAGLRERRDRLSKR